MFGATKVMLVYLVVSFQDGSQHVERMTPGSMAECNTIGKAFEARDDEVNGPFTGVWSSRLKGYDCFEVEVDR